MKSINGLIPPPPRISIPNIPRLAKPHTQTPTSPYPPSALTLTLRPPCVGLTMLGVGGEGGEGDVTALPHPSLPPPTHPNALCDPPRDLPQGGYVRPSQHHSHLPATYWLPLDKGVIHDSPLDCLLSRSRDWRWKMRRKRR